ncbi:MAG: hypothetical protein AB8H79_24890 [Myxococcota bacterium]
MLFLSLLLAPAPALAETPEGWFIAGSDRTAYESDVVDESRDGGKSARLRTVEGKRNKGFGTLMQTMKPTGYAGNRVQMTAWIKSDGVKDWAGMWLRVDGPGKGHSAFDNMGDRRIVGDTEWTRYSIVLDVDPGATNIAYGVLLSDGGTVWMDDVEFDVVDESVPVTAETQTRYEPENPSFEE